MCTATEHWTQLVPAMFILCSRSGQGCGLLRRDAVCGLGAFTGCICLLATSRPAVHLLQRDCLDCVYSIDARECQVSRHGCRFTRGKTLMCRHTLTFGTKCAPDVFHHTVRAQNRLLAAGDCIGQKYGARWGCPRIHTVVSLPAGRGESCGDVCSPRTRVQSCILHSSCPITPTSRDWRTHSQLHGFCMLAVLNGAGLSKGNRATRTCE